MQECFVALMPTVSLSQMWKNVEARVYTFAERQASNGDEDLALLERVSPEEEQRILGASRDVLVESY